jgi:AcrR family transcriptional regulator
MSPTPFPDRRARTRDQLLAAAQMLLMEQGAGSLGIRQVATAAGLVHGSFYNYYPDMEALFDDLSRLVVASHAAAVAPLRGGLADPAWTFARLTRQTLRIIVGSPRFGRLIFDAGLPVDRFVAGLRAAMGADIAAGVAQGLFAADDLEIAVSLTAGAILGAALDLHRGVLPAGAIDAAVARLLVSLGVSVGRARVLAGEEIAWPEPPSLPLRWLTTPPALREALRVA